MSIYITKALAEDSDYDLAADIREKFGDWDYAVLYITPLGFVPDEADSTSKGDDDGEA